MRFAPLLARVPIPSLLVLLLPIAAIPARASDGVVEINQTCAVATGCFEGDAEGFPVTIDGTAGHGYRLTSDLTVPDENTDAILVSTSDVTVDLNSFAILGPVVCDGGPLVCVPGPGVGSGVARATDTNRGIAVQNGSISGMGAFGVVLGEQARVVGLRVRSNGGGGISARQGSIVEDNAAYSNGGDGIAVGTGSTVVGNAAYQNQLGGIVVLSGGSVVDNVAYLNGGIGITVSNGNNVRGNVMRANGTFGLRFAGTNSTYRDNTITNNTSAPISGAGSNLGDNYCAGLNVGQPSCP